MDNEIHRLKTPLSQGNKTIIYLTNSIIDMTERDRKK